MKTLTLLLALGFFAFTAHGSDPAYIETAATLTVNGKVSSTPKGRVLTGVRTRMESRLQGVEPKTWFSVEVLPTLENGRVRYDLTVAVDKTGSEKVTTSTQGATDLSTPVKCTVTAKDGTKYDAEVTFTMAD